MRSAVSLRGRVAWAVRGCERGASAVGCGAGTVEGARRYLQDIFPTIWTAGSPPSNECALPLGPRGALHCGATAAGARSRGGVSAAGGRRQRVGRCVAARWTSWRPPCVTEMPTSGCHPPGRGWREGWGIWAERTEAGNNGAAGGTMRHTRRRYASAYERYVRPTRATTAWPRRRPRPRRWPHPRCPHRRRRSATARCRRGADPIEAPSTTQTPRSTSTSLAGRSR